MKTCLSLFLVFGLLNGNLFADEAAAPAVPEAAKETAAAPAEKAFSGDALNIKKKLDDLFDASRKVNGAEKAQSRKKIEAALDWDAVAKSCLGTAQWKSQPEKNRTEFRNLLKEVVVRTAYSRMDKFWDTTTYKFDVIDVKGADAHVVAKFVASGEPLALEYYLAKKGNDWLIYDISFEDNRYSSNINEQITAFLREKSFSALLSSLKKRRDDLAEGKTKTKNG